MTRSSIWTGWQLWCHIYSINPCLCILLDLRWASDGRRSCLALLMNVELTMTKALRLDCGRLEEVSRFNPHTIEGFVRPPHRWRAAFEILCSRRLWCTAERYKMTRNVLTHNPVHLRESSTVNSVLLYGCWALQFLLLFSCFAFSIYFSLSILKCIDY